MAGIEFHELILFLKGHQSLLKDHKDQVLLLYRDLLINLNKDQIQEVLQYHQIENYLLLVIILLNLMLL